MQNVFNAKEAQQYIDRIHRLSPDSQRKWGKMTVDQMLAHCNVTYEMVFEPAKHKKAGFIAKMIMKKFVKPKKNSVCNRVLKFGLRFLKKTKRFSQNFSVSNILINIRKICVLLWKKNSRKKFLMKKA